jgi:hypothetical protein
MWKKKDWLCLGVAAVAGFGGTLAGFYPASATADGPTAAAVKKTPTLNLDGVMVTADVAGAKAGGGFVTVVKAGLLPGFELRATNTSEVEKSVHFSADVMTSRVPNMLSRVPMPVTSPKSVWSQELTLDLKPGESRVIPVSTELALGAMSTATVRLTSSEQKVDALAMSSAMQFLQPTTGPSSEVSVQASVSAAAAR